MLIMGCSISYKKERPNNAHLVSYHRLGFKTRLHLHLSIYKKILNFIFFFKKKK